MPSFRESLTSWLQSWHIPYARFTFGHLLDGTLPRAKMHPPAAVHAPTTPPKAAPPSNRERVLALTADYLIKGEAVMPHPYWPKGRSGITIGVGYDLGQQTLSRLNADWSDLPAADLTKLATALGPTHAGTNAAALLPGLEDIDIPKDVALKVHRERVVARYYNQMLGAFPGADALPDPVQVALVSLIFNRGPKLVSSTKKHPKTMAQADAEATQTHVLDSRYEMRRIREDVAAKNIQGIADALRAMERIWVGTKIERGMKNRREDEAKMVEKGLPSGPSGKQRGPVLP